MADYISQFTGGEIDARLRKVSELEAEKQDALVSGENIKTVGGQSVLGSGDIPVGDENAVKFTPQTLTDAQKAQALANIGAASLEDVANMDFVIVTSLPTASASTMGHIYLVGPDANDNYDRYVTKLDGGSYSWVTLGSTQIDLSDYATKAEVDELEAKVTDLQDGETVLQQQIDAIQPVVIEGNVTNAPDNEDITATPDNRLKFADRPATLTNKGYKILRADKTFAEQVTDINTVYEIRYKFDLSGGEVTIPAGCVLSFVGGSIDNGTLVGNNTEIRAGLYQIFGDDLNLMYVYENGKTVWTFTNQANDLVGDLTDSVLVKYASTARGAGWLTSMSDGVTKIENNTAHLVADLFGIYRKITSASFVVKECYVDWFGLSTDGLQKAVDFAFASKSYLVKVTHDLNFTITRPIMLRSAVSVCGESPTTHATGIMVRSGGTSCFGAFQSGNSGCSIDGIRIIGENTEQTLYAFICYGAHNITITNCSVSGYFRKGGVLFGGALYPTIENCIFSMSYTNTAIATPGIDCPFCISALQATWNIAYYGVNVGVFRNCSFNGRNPLLLGAGIITVDHCDFEGGGYGKNGGVIELEGDSSTLNLTMTDNYFEVTGLDDETIKNPSIILIHGNNHQITFVNNQVYVNSLYGKESCVIDFAGYYLGGLVFKDNKLNYVRRLFNAYYVSARCAPIVINENIDVINTIQEQDARVYGTGTTSFDGNVGTAFGNYLGDRVSYRNIKGCGMLLPAGEKQNGNDLLSFGSGNIINLRGTTAKLVRDSYYIREGIFYVRNGVLLVDRNTKNWNENPLVIYGGLYQNFIPTTITVKNGNTNFTKMGVCVPIVRNGSIERVFTYGIIAASAPANPNIIVDGRGSGAELAFSYDTNGNITGINVINGGTGYDDCYFSGSNNEYLFPEFVKVTKGGIDYYRVSAVYAGFARTGAKFGAGQKSLNLDSDQNTMVEQSNIKVVQPYRVLTMFGNVPSDNYQITLGLRDVAVIQIFDGDPYVVEIIRNYAKFGTTRPTVNPEDVGYCYFDKSLSPARPIWWTGTDWVDSTGTTV